MKYIYCPECGKKLKIKNYIAYCKKCKVTIFLDKETIDKDFTITKTFDRL